MAFVVRTVDLFCGCGGLTLGFELHRGQVTYETIMGADVDPAALRVFSGNLSSPGRHVPTGRRCDLSWFSHRAEFLLYFLSHYSVWQPDRELQGALVDLGYREFLAGLRAVDARFAAEASEL